MRNLTPMRVQRMPDLEGDGVFVAPRIKHVNDLSGGEHWTSTDTWIHGIRWCGRMTGAARHPRTLSLTKVPE